MLGARISSSCALSSSEAAAAAAASLLSQPPTSRAPIWAGCRPSPGGHVSRRQALALPAVAAPGRCFSTVGLLGGWGPRHKAWLSFVCKTWF